MHHMQIGRLMAERLLTTTEVAEMFFATETPAVLHPLASTLGLTPALAGTPA